MLGPHNGRDLLEQAVLAAPMFQVRWRWNATRALAVPRRRGGKAVPPHLQKFRAEDLLAAAFPETVGCLENHHGDVVIPSHPLVQQTMHDCLTEAMDVERWLGVLGEVKAGTIRFVPRDTREPSPFSHELINANPYAFLDGAPLEERRTRAVQTRRSLNPDDFRDLTRLDPAALAQVAEEAWPMVRDAEELHDALLHLVVLHEFELGCWRDWFEQLLLAGRGARLHLPDGTTFCFAAESWPVLRSAYSQGRCEPAVNLPAELERQWEPHEAWVALCRGRTMYAGPQTTAALAALLSLEPSAVQAACEALEGEGVVLRGQFTAEAWSHSEAGRNSEWCERRLLARVHRLTLLGLRKAIAAVEPEDYWHFLATLHGVLPGEQREGPSGVRSVVEQLEAFELAAGAWERFVLPSRVRDYQRPWLDELFLTGECTWGRLSPVRRDDETPLSATFTRVIPVALLFRERLASLIATPAAAALPLLRSLPHDLYQLLLTRGASFLPELARRAAVLPSQVEEALGELAALGLVTADTFAAVRAMSREQKKSRRTRKSSSSGAHGSAGRWSCFPDQHEPTTPAARLEAWCRLLVRRYGVVFRDLLTRESAAPAWSELVPYFRRLELRGEIRGGRFVARVAGEQYGLESTISRLREARERRQNRPATADDWCVLSAADPLNLAGIITSQARLTANPRNAFVLHGGRVVAMKQGGQVEFLEPVPGVLQYHMRRALQIGYRETEFPLETVPKLRLRRGGE
jgi:ATP-dependent Lhr-like helicase